MPPYPQWYDSTDTTLQEGVFSVTSDAGTTYDPGDYHLWNDKGGTLGGSLMSEARLIGEVWDDDNSMWVTSGFPILDEKWCHVKVTGYNSTGDSTMAAQTTGFVPIGANSPLVLQPIPANCARHVEIEFRLPAGAQELTQDFRLTLLFNEASISLPYRGGLSSGSGVIADATDATLRRIVRGFGLTASGAATVAVAKGTLVYDGTRVTKIAQTVTLNQTAANGALASGESYKARLSLTSAGAVTTTKSNKGASPSTPNVPTGEINLGVVTVGYQGGGTSIITSGNVSTSGVVKGEYLVEAGTGLNVTIGGGYAITSTDISPLMDVATTLAVTDNTTNYVWLWPDGSFTDTTTSTAPEVGAILLATVVASGGAITSVTDGRKLVSRADDVVEIRLEKSGSVTATATDFAWDSLKHDAYLESVALEMGTLGGVSGSLKIDVKTRAAGASMGGAGTTIYTSSGTSDLRPALAYNATSLRTENFDHEVIHFTRGTRFSADIVSVPGTPSGTDLIVILTFRRR
jgi:hypothetical protein